MKVTMFFPRCKVCGTENKKAFHEDCPNGSYSPLKIDPDNRQVYCPCCGRNWHLSNSTYHCVYCGKVYSYDEIADELAYIVSLAQIVARRMRNEGYLVREIDDYTKKSFTDFIFRCLKSVGVTAGYIAGIIDNVLEIVKTVFKS